MRFSKPKSLQKRQLSLPKIIGKLSEKPEPCRLEFPKRDDSGYLPGVGKKHYGFTNCTSVEKLMSPQIQEAISKYREGKVKGEEMDYKIRERRKTTEVADIFCSEKVAKIMPERNSVARQKLMTELPEKKMIVGKMKPKPLQISPSGACMKEQVVNKGKGWNDIKRSIKTEAPTHEQPLRTKNTILKNSEIHTLHSSQPSHEPFPRTLNPTYNSTNAVLY